MQTIILQKKKKNTKKWQIMLCTTNNRGCQVRESWSPLQKLSQAERLNASEGLGGVWSWVELDGSLLGVLLCTASSSCLSRRGKEAKGALCQVGEREREVGGRKERRGYSQWPPPRPGRRWEGERHSWSYRIPLPAAFTTSLPSSSIQGREDWRVTGQNI